MFATACSTPNCPNPPPLDLLTARIRESYGLQDPKGPKALKDLANLSAEAAINLYGRTDRLSNLMRATRHDDPKVLAEIAESLRQTFKWTCGARAIARLPVSLGSRTPR